MDTLIIWLEGWKNIIPAGVASTLDKMARGRCFIAKLTLTVLLQQGGNGISKVPEVLKKKRNWLVF